MAKDLRLDRGSIRTGLGHKSRSSLKSSLRLDLDLWPKPVLMLPRSPGRLLDILRGQGPRGLQAFMESLEFYHPEQFTLLTGQKATQRCSLILGEYTPTPTTTSTPTSTPRLPGAPSLLLSESHDVNTETL